MEKMYVKTDKQKTEISKSTFEKLLDFPWIKDLKCYKVAEILNQISLANLKNLAIRADVPYPLFFAPESIVNLHITDNQKRLEARIPTKDEITLSSRGSFKGEDIELLAKDLGRKQFFLGNRILKLNQKNTFVGCIADKVKKNFSNEEIANILRDKLSIDLKVLRRGSKEKVLEYFVEKVENLDILVSFSSHNYMPQKIGKNVLMSGICIKDNKFPYIFINTRDGDDDPRILETPGRQVFTLVSMVVCVAMNKFVFSNIRGKQKDLAQKKLFSIAGEILIPKVDLKDIKIISLDDVETYAGFFKVTPSMLLFRLDELNMLDKKAINQFREMLSDKLKKAERKGSKRSPLPINGYSKYNGSRFSKEVVRAYKKKIISQEEVGNVLFRKGKINQTLFQNYIQKFE